MIRKASRVQTHHEKTAVHSRGSFARSENVVETGLQLKINKE